MTRTITALFDDRSDAEAAQERLKQSNVDADHVRIHDKSSEGYSETSRSTHEDRGIWASIKNAFLPDEDRHTYEEGVRRGGYLLTADVDDDAVADAVRVLEEANTVDIDERAGDWRSSGWDYAPGEAAAVAASYGAGSAPDRSFTSTDDVASTGTPSIYSRRDLDRGSSRVRSYGNDPYTGFDARGSEDDHDHDTGSRVKGMADEAIGNVKQATGSVLGNDKLKQEGVEQERRGEAEQGKGPDRSY
ncbi:MAG: hypothetical protein EON55_02470 [Alphaproteobacteria bacterium]|nr:MAG: hypothetical protein EON55_02470 [Alphaproteobacteria bacterium]